MHHEVKEGAAEMPMQQSSASKRMQKHNLNYRLDRKCDPLQPPQPLTTLFYYLQCSAAHTRTLQLKQGQ